jgi:hypothetical protein
MEARELLEWPIRTPADFVGESEIGPPSRPSRRLKDEREFCDPTTGGEPVTDDSLEPAGTDNNIEIIGCIISAPLLNSPHGMALKSDGGPGGTR